jgi:phenylacetate-CoA ligase
MHPLQKQIYDMLMESQFWLPETMLDYQRSQLSQLLHHARAQVPFYKTRLNPVFRKNGAVDWDRWQEIPIIKRQHLAKERERMLARQLPPGHGTTSEVYSSGSSGMPIVTSHSSLARWASGMAEYRAHCWHKLDWSKNFVSLHIGDGGNALWPHGWNKGAWGPAWMKEVQQGTKYVLDRATHEEKIVEFLLRNNATYVSGRPTSLQTLALGAERLNLELKLDAVMTFGSEPREVEHTDVKRVLGARVISLYSSGEGYKMGVTCETAPHYHMDSELTFLEILDGNDQPCPVGQPGRVIITPLFNTAQPLIRYEQGDIAVRGKECSCGKTLPVIRTVSGRLNQLFHLPGNRKIAPFMPDKEFTMGFGANTWQLVQIGPLSVELRYVWTDPTTRPNEAFATGMICRTIHPELKIKFVELSETPLTAAGKFIQYKSELAQAT